MANDNTASRSRRNRLTRRRRPSRPVRDLAGDLLRIEYGLRNYHRRDGAGRTPSFWGDMWDGLRRMADRIMGRSRSAPDGGGHPPGDGGYAPEREGYTPVGGRSDALDGGGYAPRGGPEVGPYVQPTTPGRGGPAQASADERTWRSSSEETAFGQMWELERFVNGLPELQRHAFEDEILRRVQEDKKWRKVHDKFPERMPAMMTYANNAFERELRRQAAASTEPERRERRSSNPEPTRVTATEAMNNARDAITAHDAEQFAAYRARWERDAPRQRSVGPKESGFSHSGENAMIDSFAFEEAARVTREWREWEKERSTANLRNPGQDPLSDAVAFNAVGDAAVARGTVGSEGLSPLSAADPFEEAERVRREWEKERSTANSRDPGRDPSSDPVQEAEDARRVWAGEIEPLIDKEGRQLLGEQPSVKGRGGRTSPSSSTHTPVSQNHTRSNTPAPRGR